MKNKSPQKASGHRGEHDADRCRKTDTTAAPAGEVNTKTVKWSGFRLHLITDATYGLPVDFTVTKASASEVKEMERRDALSAGLLELQEQRQAAEAKQFMDAFRKSGKTMQELMTFLDVTQEKHWVTRAAKYREHTKNAI